MGLFSRRKGQREEQEIVRLHKAHGFDALRVPLSGMSEGFKGDVIVHGLTGEAKLRAKGFKLLYEWLGANDFLTLRQDGNSRLYVVNEALWLRLLRSHINSAPAETVEQRARERGAA